MNGNQGKKRPPRNPLSPEEVADFIAVKKLREQLKLQRFKKTKRFKYLNIFNVVCFFIYCELLICFFSPCHYRTHYSKKVDVEYSQGLNELNQLKIAHVKITDVNNNLYQFMVNDFIDIPKKYDKFSVGKDFILQKELKGTFIGSNKYYRIQRAEPFLFLSGFLVILLCIIFSYNLNLTESSLKAISVINGLTILGFLLI